MRFDLYDFDKTVFPHDSETCFLFYCIARRPYLLLVTPYLLVNLILFFAGCGDKFKGRCFAFLRFIDGEAMAKEFWQKHQKDIYPIFNPEGRALPVVVCSASPEFFLKPICDRFEVHTLIATRMNPKTGEIIGRNCKDDEKVNRISEALPGAEFERVFSDSLHSDIHIFRLGNQCFHAQKGTLTEMTLDEIEKRVEENKK